MEYIGFKIVIGNILFHMLPRKNDDDFDLLSQHHRTKFHR